MTDIQISDEMKKLILAYMEACNADEYAKSEELLHKIKQQGIIDYESQH